MGNWRLAESLKQLREQVNARWPYRDKSSDGAIGDASHATRDSDHNPWVRDFHGNGVVTAIDIDADLSPLVKVDVLVAALIKSRDPRIKYIIHDRHIIASYPVGGYKAWSWRPYSGKNAHTHHAHVSVQSDPGHYDSRAAWNIGAPEAAAAEPVLEVPPIEKPATHAAEPTEKPVEIPQPSTQNAESITNVVQQGDKTVPDNFVPEDKEINAPAADGSTAKSTKLTIAGFVVPAFLVAMFRAIGNAIHDGYVDARDVGNAVIGFLTSNQKFVFIAIALVVIGIMLKKLYKQVTLWLSMYIAARADMHNVTVKPQ
jgi:hypothetical protein